jgi:hypothetical protein
MIRSPATLFHIAVTLRYLYLFWDDPWGYTDLHHSLALYALEFELNMTSVFTLLATNIFSATTFFENPNS